MPLAKLPTKQAAAISTRARASQRPGPQTEIRETESMSTETLPAVIPQQSQALSFNDAPQFEHIQRVAKMFASSALVPPQFHDNLPNVVIALEIASRMQASPLAVMQSLYLVHGKPAWSSSFIIACINTCGRFEPLMFEVSGEGDAKQCVAWTTPKGVKLPVRNDGKAWTIALAKDAGLQVLDGSPVSIELAKKEGWYSKNGSKWLTMPDLMLRYRAATFFGRIYAPELLMGMKSYEEVIDVDAKVVQAQPEPRFAKPLTPPGAAEAEVAPVISEPQRGSEESTTQATPETAAEPPPAPQSKAAELAEFFQREAGAEFAAVKAVLLKNQPKAWLDIKDANSFEEMPDAAVERLHKTRVAWARQVKAAGKA